MHEERGTSSDFESGADDHVQSDRMRAVHHLDFIFFPLSFTRPISQPHPKRRIMSSSRIEILNEGGV
jgi:hypothetical protein